MFFNIALFNHEILLTIRELDSKSINYFFLNKCVLILLKKLIFSQFVYIKTVTYQSKLKNKRLL